MSAQEAFMKMVYLSKIIPKDCGKHGEEVYFYTEGCPFCERLFNRPCCKKIWNTCVACGSQMCTRCRDKIYDKRKEMDIDGGFGDIVCPVCHYVDVRKREFNEGVKEVTITQEGVEECQTTKGEVDQNSCRQKEATTTSAQEGESLTTLVGNAQNMQGVLRSISPKTARCVVAGLPGGVATADITSVNDAEHICVSNVQELSMCRETQNEI